MVPFTRVASSRLLDRAPIVRSSCDVNRGAKRWPVGGAVVVGVLVALFISQTVVDTFGAGPVSAAAAAAPTPVRQVSDTSAPAAVDTAPRGDLADAAVGSASAQKETTIPYCHEGGSTETLDVYESSPAPTRPVPAVVYVHGGGWTGGDDTIAPDTLIGRAAAAIGARGWVFVSIDYRLAPRFPWPAQIEDAKCAVRFLRHDALTLHIDPRHIGAIGDSAGGQISALLGLAGPRAGFDVGPYLRQSSAVQAVVDLFGPTDLTAPDWNGSYVQADAPGVFGTVLGPAARGTGVAARLVAASPVTYVGRREPPFLIIQGDGDTVVPPEQSVELTDRLQAAGNAPTLVMVHNAQHEFSPASAAPVTPSVAQLAVLAVAFLVRHLSRR